MKAPQFWHKKNIISFLLWPFSLLYLLGHNLKSAFTKQNKINTPVLCIGNLVAGGAGKTPVAIEIGKMLQELNIDFAYLSSGYGGQIKDFTLVNNHSSKQVGDEPLLLSEIAPVFVCKKRLIGAIEISKIPSKKLIVMDDGLQNLSVKKDFSILVIDGNYGFGNGFAIPAGAMRESIAAGIKKVDLIIIVGLDKNNIAKKYCRDKKIIGAKIKPKNADQFLNKPVIAFCGIGRPEKFFNSLENSNIRIIDKFSYADHHYYKKSEIEKMLDLANKNNANLITTKKDWVRLDEEYKKLISYLDIEIELEDRNYIKQKLIELVK